MSLHPIAHRILSIEDSEKIPKDIGLEFDVHAYNQKLVIAHDSFHNGDDFEDYLWSNRNRVLAINVKEEGIEDEIIRIANKVSLDKYFMFDLSFPVAYKMGQNYRSNICLRVSQYEMLNYKKCSDISSYLWVDTFDGSFWMTESDIENAQNNNFNLCFVSPELHYPSLRSPSLIDTRKFDNKINSIKNSLSGTNYICTKNYQKWI
ncbi:hypothetical protein [Prochlorococcus marinus]|uniref:hypothetical protein n=1 Tax=Prochlorococcus marinus TaxID=1219 RepID=UPI0022B349F6|nr:hypothetical protein [Prochlorococcus marinus]